MQQIFSFSQIACYLESPDHYYKYYVKKEKRPFSKEAYFGTLLHNTLQRFYEYHVMENPTDNKQSLFAFEEKTKTPQKQDLLEIFDTAITKGNVLDPSEQLAMHKEGHRVLSLFYDTFTKEAFGNPWLIEKKFVWPISNTYALQWRFDRVDAQGASAFIIDYKSRSRYVTDTKALQLDIYRYAIMHKYPHITDAKTAFLPLDTCEYVFVSAQYEKHMLCEYLYKICQEISKMHYR